MRLDVCGPEPRPCVVTFDGEEEHRAVFHLWTVKQRPGQALFAGEVPGQVSYLVGVVEYEDGSVHEVRPSRIRFTDGLCGGNCFEVKS